MFGISVCKYFTLTMLKETYYKINYFHFMKKQYQIHHIEDILSFIYIKFHSSIRGIYQDRYRSEEIHTRFLTTELSKSTLISSSSFLPSFLPPPLQCFFPTTHCSPSLQCLPHSKCLMHASCLVFKSIILAHHWDTYRRSLSIRKSMSLNLSSSGWHWKSVLTILSFHFFIRKRWE